ncbi:formyltetrahydrofolate deformylase [Gloeobacter kilaueensis]|uniref:Formyltetrahydrofolate deformylase n=1 Tax=Gloeobacter kilaueensis (strain ATCC BAA-2537 / CCAP 1431/1 / ULC 316 / JS1) TaxID=1183438 RepID=U5QIE5_GLOK1|nr:formyltetrahydrofolate deformylase [Gloeobacter kilaueensis]AGY58663.1 formyltetrahydrofolate deformylase [Gloeobacter kilaueensis JS1]
MPPAPPTRVLLISCPDRQGIVAAVSLCVLEAGGNIVRSDQHSTDLLGGVFFMRLEFLYLEPEQGDADFTSRFAPVAAHYEMDWRLVRSDQPKRMALFVSRLDHCLIDLLWRWRSGELAVKIPLIISNHPDLEAVAAGYGLPFYLFAIDRDNQAGQEERMLALLEGQADFLVLARYMRILGPRFVERYCGQIINIHHSFLPAFIGASPYERAYERGVKVIGATAHYVTAALDEGPIIEQDVTRVNHRDQVADLKLKGRDLERIVLARAVKWHIEDRVLIYGNRTVVFT